MWYKDVKKGFGLAIKVWRGKSGISQEELAWRAGLHRTYVADIERGARNPSLLSLEKIARALKVSFSTLFEPMENFPAGGEGATNHSDMVEILLVDDNPAEAEATVRVLRDAHVMNHVHVAHDAPAALEFLWHSPRWDNPVLKGRPRLVFLGLDVEGMEVLRRLKADAAMREIPIVALTSKRDNRQLQDLRRQGVELYLPKPMNLEDFSALLSQLSCNWGLLATSRTAPIREAPPKQSKVTA